MNRTGRLIALLSAIAAGAVLTGCGGSAPAASSGFGEGRLTLSGASTAAPLVNEIARRFESRHSGVRIDVQTGGSSRGVADVRRGTVGIGMVSRPLGSDESDLTAYRIAMDGVALIVHRDNRVSELTRQQIIDIYSGRIENWSAVGGASDCRGLGPARRCERAARRGVAEIGMSQAAVETGDFAPCRMRGPRQREVLRSAYKLTCH